MTRLTVSAADTRLDSTDTPGAAPSLLFLNGAFGTQRDWQPVLQRLGRRYRTVTFDARARGRSGTSADYSFGGALEDVDRVATAVRLERPVLVGWSHGATLAVRHAAEHSDRVAGLLLVDGGFPARSFSDASREDARRQFRRMAPLMWVLARLGRSARMSAADAAEVLIELDEVNGDRLGADFDALTCPIVYVLGTGAHPGSDEERITRLRRIATETAAAHDNVTVFATAPCNHMQLLSTATATVVAAIDDVIGRATAGEGTSPSRPPHREGR